MPQQYLFEKLWFLTILGTMDSWKILLTIKNMLKTSSARKSGPEMTALRELVNGVPKSDIVAHVVCFANLYDICTISFKSLDRFFRIAVGANALTWELKQEADSIFPPFVDYVISMIILNILPIYLLRVCGVASSFGHLTRRSMILLKESVEVILVTGWILVLQLMANNEALDSWIFFGVGVIVALQGFLFYLAVLSVDEELCSYDLDNYIISGQLEPLWDISSGLLKLNYSDNWEVKYVGVLGHNVILVDKNVVSALPVDHVSALVGFELGQWKYRHSIPHYAIPILRTAALGVLLMESYGSQIINNIFGFNQEPDPSVPMFIAYIWIWPYILDVMNYLDSLFSYWTVLRGDRLALERHNIVDLTTALNHVAGSTEHYPIFDGLYSAWLLGRPTVQTRIQKLNKTLEKENFQ